MQDNNIPTTFVYDGETIELDEELRASLPLLGRYSWCVVLKEFPQLAQFCTRWDDMPSCGEVWDDMIAAHPQLYAYVLTSS